MPVAINDAYQWAVTYQDGMHLQEFDAICTIGRGFAEIGDKPIKDVWLITPDPNLDYGHHVSVPLGASPVFFRRRTIRIDPIIGTQDKSTVHCIGWKRGESGVFLFVWPDGSTLLSDNFQAV